jgi:hypothetical protein
MSAAGQDVAGLAHKSYEVPQPAFANQSAQLEKLFAALSKAQAKVEGAVKGKKNPAFPGSKYADLASVWDACRGPLAENELCVIQQPLNDGPKVGLRTTIGHASGQWIASTVWTTPKDQGPQALGSCLTYLRRYSLSAAVGVAPDDDDGNAAEGRAEGKAPAPRVASATSAAGTSRPTTETAPSTSRASDIKHDGSKASPDQVKLLHVLKGKLGVQECDGSCVRETVKVTKTKGQVPITVRCLYHTQLAKFTDQAGKAITSSKDLSIAQMSHLLDSYHRKMEKMTEKTENLRPLDLEAQDHARDPGCDDEPPMADAGDLADLEDAARKRWGDGFAPKFNQWLAGAFDYDSVLQLHKQEAIDAVRMLGEGK